MAPPFVDEDTEGALVEQGLSVAEDERRRAVADAYEATARISDDPSESLDDIDYEDDEPDPRGPEVAAMHEIEAPEEDGEEE